MSCACERECAFVREDFASRQPYSLILHTIVFQVMLRSQQWQRFVRIYNPNLFILRTKMVGGADIDIWRSMLAGFVRNKKKSEATEMDFVEVASRCPGYNIYKKKTN